MTVLVHVTNVEEVMRDITTLQLPSDPMLYSLVLDHSID